MTKLIAVIISLLLFCFLPITMAQSQNSYREIYENHRVFLIGDSQVVGPFGRNLGIELANKNVAYFARAGREGWGVGNWLQHQYQIPRLLNRHRPTIVLLALGGNDFNRSQNPTYSTEIETLWSIINNKMSSMYNDTDIKWSIFWIGPATAVGRSSHIQEGRARAADIIKNVVGEEKFINSADITGEFGRTEDGVHFTPEGGREWARAVVNRLKQRLERE